MDRALLFIAQIAECAEKLPAFFAVHKRRRRQEPKDAVHLEPAG